jgi:hypothetical protein
LFWFVREVGGGGMLSIGSLTNGHRGAHSKCTGRGQARYHCGEVLSGSRRMVSTFVNKLMGAVAQTQHARRSRCVRSRIWAKNDQQSDHPG